MEWLRYPYIYFTVKTALFTFSKVLLAQDVLKKIKQNKWFTLFCNYELRGQKTKTQHRIWNTWKNNYDGLKKNQNNNNKNQKERKKPPKSPQQKTPNIRLFWERNYDGYPNIIHLSP